jgi:hypothetical protein
MRRLELHSTGVGIEEEAIVALCTFRPLRMALPRLEILRYSQRTPTLQRLGRYIPYFVTDSLKEVQIIVGDDRSRLPSLLSSFANICPQIQTFALTAAPEEISAEESSALGKFIVQQTELKKLLCEGLRVTPEILSYLAHLPSLQIWSYVSIEPSVVRSSDLVPMFGKHWDNAFKSLTDLSISKSSWDSICTLLEMLASPLEELMIASPEAIQNPTPNHIRRVCSAAARFTGLRVFRLIRTEPLEESESALSSFEPLYTLNSIEEFNCTGFVADPLNASFLAEISKAWPRLQSLHIIPCNPSIPLPGLISLAKNCKSLKTLQIALEFDPMELSAGFGVSNEGVEEVEISASSLEVDYSLEVLRVLTHMFPYATSIQGNYYLEPYQDAWEEFNEVSERFLRRRY